MTVFLSQYGMFQEMYQQAVIRLLPLFKITYLLPGLSMSSIICVHSNFVMHKVRPDEVTAGAIKQNYKAIIDRFVASDNTFFYISSVKGTLPYWKQFSEDVIALVKQLSPIFPYMILCRPNVVGNSMHHK